MSENRNPRKNQKRTQRPPNAEEVALGLDFLSDYFAGIKAKVQVSAKSQSEINAEREVIFEITGDLKPLKRNPQQVSALSRLTSMAMSADSKNFFRCALDLAGHLSARRALLEVIAEDAAAVAKHTHKRAIVEGLSSYERRKVHNAVNQDSEVETLSNGEGEFRYMMVAIKT